MTLDRSSRLKIVGALAVLLVPLFLFLHTGSRATSVCESNGFSSPSGLSLVPLGTRCEPGGAFGDAYVDLHPAFVLAVLVIVVGGIVLWWHRPRSA